MSQPGLRIGTLCCAAAAPRGFGFLRGCTTSGCWGTDARSALGADYFSHAKKDGQQRMICDAREANRAHHAPPKVRLGGPGALAELDLSDEALIELGGLVRRGL